MSQSDIEVSASEPSRSRFGTEASPELVTSQPDIEASQSETDTSHFDIGVSQPVGPISQSAGVALWPKIHCGREARQAVGSATLLRGRLRRCHPGHRHRRHCCADVTVYRRVLVLVEFFSDSRLLGFLPIIRACTICLDSVAQNKDRCDNIRLSLVSNRQEQENEVV
jgi:hypothetical protein